MLEICLIELLLRFPKMLAINGSVEASFDPYLKKQGNPDVPTDPASTAITAILFLRICFFCYAVSTKFLLL